MVKGKMIAQLLQIFNFSFGKTPGIKKQTNINIIFELVHAKELDETMPQPQSVMPPLLYFFQLRSCCNHIQ